MKIFVTIGTTPFDSLMKYIDENVKGHDIIFQISTGTYFPKTGKTLKFVDNINDYYEWSDVVITHAGAGTIYRLLEMEKKIIAVPNLERLDNHQIELADFVEENNYGLKAEKFEQINDLLINLDEKNFEKYKKDRFFVELEIINFLNS